MDTPPWKISLREGNPQGPQGQFRVNLAGDSISKGFSRVHVQNSSQIDKGCQDSNIGNIRKPNLVDRSSHQIANQVGKDPIRVVALRGPDPPPPGAAEKIVLPHHPEHSLVIDPQPLPVKGFGHSPIPIPGKLQHDGLYEIPKVCILSQLGRGLSLWLILVSTGGQVHEFAPPPDRLHKASVVGKELSFLSALSRVFSSAFFKNSFSMVRRPTICSGLAIRSCKAASWAGSLPNLPRQYCFLQ